MGSRWRDAKFNCDLVRLGEKDDPGPPQEPGLCLGAGGGHMREAPDDGRP